MQMERRIAAAVIAVVNVGALAVAAAAAAQTLSPPASPSIVSVILPNYNSLPIGETAGLEGGAFVARASDPSSGYYNPAGLVRAEQSALSGSAGVFQFASISPDTFTNVESSFQQIPAMFAFVRNDLLGRPNLAGGLSLTRVNAWSQEAEAERIDNLGGSANRFRFSTDANFDAWLTSLGLAYAPGTSRGTFGGSMDFQYTSAARRQLVTDQNVGPTGLSAFAYTSDGSVSALHLRASLGTQVNLTPAVRVGVVMRTPGLTILNSSSASLESLAESGATTTSTSFFEPSGDTEFRLPWEFKGGVAWIGRRAQFEVDLQAYTGTGDYSLTASSTRVVTVGDDGTGSPTATTRPYVGPQVHGRGVVNVAIGGHYGLSEGGVWTLHGGYATDRSPVGDNDTAFTRVNQHRMTVGVSGRTSLLVTSVGVQYVRGRTDPLTFDSPLEPERATRFTVSTIGLVYSVSILF